MGIEVKLEAFEGPLDLLLHLIEKNKIDIYDIPVAEITDQYMEYVEKIKEADLDTMSDFLMVAAQLINIKSRMLLPVEKDENEEDIDPRAELVERLLEYKMYKYSAGLLKERAGDAGDMLFKSPTIPDEVAKYEEKPDVKEIIGDLTLAKLHNIFNFVIKKQADKRDPIRSTFGKIKKEPISLIDCMKEIRSYATANREFSFKAYLTAQPDRLHIVVSFLAILELMKLGVIKALRTDDAEDIKIRFEGDGKLTEEEFEQIGDF